MCEYLLLKGVKANAVHASKSQGKYYQLFLSFFLSFFVCFLLTFYFYYFLKKPAERNTAIDQFKANQIDVLVASDVAAKGGEEERNRSK